MRWYRKAAEQGHADAQNNLGVMYDNGKGVRQDYTNAVQWYRKAAEQGHAGAQINLGMMYEKGQGVRQSKIVAKEWFKKACANGDKQSCDAYQKLD